MIYICLLEATLCQPPGHRLSWLPVTGSVQEGARWHLNVDRGLGISDFLSSSKLESHSAASNSLPPHGLYKPWNSPGQNIGVGSFSLLQGIFPTQGLNPGLRHCRQILYQLSHKGSPLNHLVYGVLLRQPNQTRRMFIGKQLWLGSESQDMLQNEERVPLNDP